MTQSDTETDVPPRLSAGEESPVGLAVDDGAGGGFGIGPEADVTAIGHLALTKDPRGMAFGPLTFASYEGASSVLSSLEFLPELEASSLLGLAAVGTVGGASATAAADDDAPMTRRQTIALTATVLGGAALATRASAIDDELAVAKFELSTNEVQTSLTIRDTIANVLPADVEYYIDYEGTRVSEITDPTSDGPRGVASLTRTGEYRLYTEDSASIRTRLLAWASGILEGPEVVTFEFELDQRADQMVPADDSEDEDEDDAADENEGVVLTRHPVVTRPIAEDDGSSTILTVGETSIPHEDESLGESHGEYRVEDRGDEEEDLALVFVPGRDAPASKNVTLDMHVSLVAGVMDAASRLR